MASRATAGRYRSVLRHPIASRLLAAQLVSEVGDFVGLTALALLAFTATNSALGPALVLATRSLPALAVAGLFGGWLDRPPRRVALIGLHLAGAVAVSVPMLAPGTGTAVLAAALLGATRSAFRSIQAAVIAESVDPAVRLPFFGAAGVINQSSQVIGVLVGATVTLAVGVRSALLADVVSFLLAAGVLATLPLAAPASRPTRRPAMDGIRIILHQPTLRWLAVLVLASGFSGSLAEALAPAIAHTRWLPAVMAAPAAGGMMFTLVVARTPVLRRVRNQVRVVAGLAAALALTGVAVLLRAPDWLLVAGNVAVGGALGWLVGAQATFAALTPTGRMGQVEATIVAGLITAGGGGVLLLGALASAASPAVSYLAGGGLLGLALAAAARRLTPEP